MTEAAKEEAKAGEEDLSMEEILQSIRKIIADDDGDGKKPDMATPAKTNGTKTAGRRRSRLQQCPSSPKW